VTPLLERALLIATSQVGIREVGRNRGPRVEEYLRSVDLPPGSPWCAAFIFWTFEQAARELGLPNPCPRTGSVHGLLRRSPTWRCTREPRPGLVFLHDAGGGTGHCGFITGVIEDGPIITVEGNTEDLGSRDGDGVYQRRRTRAYLNMPCLDFGAEEPVG